MPELLNDDEVSTALDDLPHWQREGDALVRAVEADSFAGGIRLVDQVAVTADERDHHPDIDIRWTTITFRLSSHAAGGLTQADVDLAHAIDAVADQG